MSLICDFFGLCESEITINNDMVYTRLRFMTEKTYGKDQIKHHGEDT